MRIGIHGSVNLHLRRKLEGDMAETKELTWATVNFRYPAEVAEFDKQEGKRLRQRRDAAVRDLQQKGILDAQGRLIKTELPPDMRPDSPTEFGG